MTEAEPWQSRGACIGKPTEWWYPQTGGADGPDAAQAKRICFKCPVEQECLAYALANRELHGIWGGKSERQRRSLRIAMRPAGDFGVRSCGHCGARFKAKASNHHYCSRRCNQRAWEARNYERARALKNESDRRRRQLRRTG